MWVISTLFLASTWISLRLSVLVHSLLFNIYLMYLLVRMVLSAVLKFSGFIISLFFTSLTSRIFVLLFLMCTHILFNNNFLASKNFIKNYANRHPSHLIYDNNLFDNFNLFNMYLILTVLLNLQSVWGFSLMEEHII